jgi:hypothetical protein
MGDLQSMYKNKSFAAIMMVALMLSFVSCSSAEKVAGNKVDGARNIASTSDAAMDLEDVDDDGLPASEVNTDLDRIGGSIENRKTGDLLVLACAKADEKKQCQEFSFVIIRNELNLKDGKQKNQIVNTKAMTLEQVSQIGELVYGKSKIGKKRFFGWTIGFWTGNSKDSYEIDDRLTSMVIGLMGGDFTAVGIVASFLPALPLGTTTLGIVLLPVLPTVLDVAKAPFMYGGRAFVNGMRKHHAKKDQKLFDEILLTNVMNYRLVSNRRFERLIHAIEVVGR